MNMYFIKDGKKYTIKPPKPKTDKDGNIVEVKGALHGRLAAADMREKVRQDRVRGVRDARDRVFGLEEDAAVLKSAGIDPALGMALVPGFNLEEYAETPQDEKSSYASNFRRRVLFDRSVDEQLEVLEIANENLRLLRESGLSVAEIDAADKAKLLNMSGRTPSFLAQDGDTLNSGSIRFARRKKKGIRIQTEEEQKAYMDEVRSQFPGLEDDDLFVTDKDLEEFDGARSILLGYDRSKEKVGTGIFQQLRRLIGGKNIISTHRNAAMLDRVYDKIKEQIAEDRKKGGPNKGFIVIATAALDVGSLAGNPNIFADIARKYVDEGVTLEERMKRANEVLQSLSKADYEAFIRASRKRRGEIHSRVRSRLNPTEVRFKIDSEETLSDLLNIFDDVEGFDESGFAKSFDDRNRLARKFIGSFLIEDIRGRTEKQAVNDYLVENYADLALEKVPGASVVTLQKLPYTLTGKPLDVPKSVLEEAVDDSAAFPAALISETAEKTKVLKTPIPIEAAYPSKVKKTEKDPTGIKSAKQKGARGTEGKIELGPRLNTRDDGTTEHDSGRRQSRRKGRQSFKMEDQTAFQKWKNLWIRRLQDKYIDIFNIQESIERQRGKVGREQDFRMAEELMYGKAAEDLAKLDKRVEEITSLMKRAGIKVDEVSRYLYALHAKERNAVIAERSKGAIKDGSGISDAEADAILNSANKKALDPIVSKIRQIQQDTRDTMVKYGLETKETVDAFEEMFQNYVPLAGLSVDEDLGSPYPTGGAGMNVFGPTTRRATGRKTEAENILAQVVAQNASIHIKARTNEALNTLYNLVKENPNTKIWRL